MIDMKVGVLYVVTKSSDNGSFQKGNHIKLYGDGMINRQEDAMWFDKEETSVATFGMEVTVDIGFLEKQLKESECLVAKYKQEIEDVTATVD